MKVNVKYFGMIAEKVGHSSQSLDIENNTNLREFFEAKFLGLKNQKYKIVVNQEFTEKLTNSSQNIEIALLPPFAGG